MCQGFTGDLPGAGQGSDLSLQWAGCGPPRAAEVTLYYPSIFILEPLKSCKNQEEESCPEGSSDFQIDLSPGGHGSLFLPFNLFVRLGESIPLMFHSPSKRVSRGFLETAPPFRGLEGCQC